MGMSVSLVAVALLALSLAAGPSHAGEWDGCGVGSWVRVEWCTSGGRAARSYQVTTTLKRKREGDLWFEHRNTRGQQFEDGLIDDDALWWGKSWSSRDTVVGFENVVVEGRSIRCRVTLTETRAGPPCGNDPLSHWIDRTWRWVAEDTTLAVRELRRVSGAREFVYEDGHITQAGDSTIWRVIRMRDVVWLNGRPQRCTLTTVAPCVWGASPEGRLTTWECDGIPTGWVRQRHEGRDPKTGQLVVTTTRVLDYELK